MAVLTLNAYRKIGVCPAHSHAAQSACMTLWTRERGWRAVRLFLRLVSLGEGTEETRRRSAARSFRTSAVGTMQTVMDEFGRHRLLSFDRDP